MSEKTSSGAASSAAISRGPGIGLRELLDASPDVIFCCDADGRFQWLSAGVESLLGSKPGDLLDRPFTQLVPPAERKRVARRLLRLSRKSSGSFEERLTLTGASGRPTRVALRARRVERPDGETIFVGAAQPATDGAETVPRAADATTLPGFDPTVRPVATAPPGVAAAPDSGARFGPPIGAAQLKLLTSELEQARASVRQKADFLAMMSHELRTPMNGVMSMTQLLLESRLDTEQRGLVDVIQTSARALVMLINDTLDFSRLEAGKLPLEKIDFDLRVTVEQVMALVMPAAREKSLDLRCEVHHEVPSRLKGDPSRLRQALMNFASNAIKFTEKGEVEVRVERLDEDDARVWLRFAVRDTGIGLTPEQAKNIFDPYVQGESSTPRRFGGSGLGLAISQQLVELMGGEVGVVSESLKGSTFWFTLPFEQQAEAGTGPEAPAVQLRGLRVLVVDPSPNVRASLVEMLAAWGCRADQAEHCEDALTRMRDEAARGERYDVALIELEQPGLDGEQFGWTVRSDEKLSQTLTMLMTSVGRRGDAARAQTLGFSAYLVKPVQWSELYAALTEVVSNARVVSEGATPLVTRHTLAEAKRRRVRILLVEDNAVNQMVADTALKRLGYTIDKAGDANIALEMVEKNRYDVILMDIQMPGMDGYRASSAIRALEHGGPRVPIVAMTGNVAPGERERCIASGMQDFLEKPVDLARLCAVVERWAHAGKEAATGVTDAPSPESASGRGAAGIVPPGTGGAKPVRTLRVSTKSAAAKAGAEPKKPVTHVEFAGPYAAVPSEPAPAAPRRAAVTPSDLAKAAETALDNARLDQSSMGIPALRNSLLQTFLTEIHPRLDRLRDAVRDGDPRRIEFEAHGLKGMCHTVGATLCSELFSQIERMAEREALTQAPEILERAGEEAARVEEHIRKLDPPRKAA